MRPRPRRGSTEFGRHDVRHLTASESHGERQDIFGGLPQAIAQQLRSSELGPLLRYLGFGPQAGSGREARQDKRLAGATGPLAGLIRDVRGFAGDVIPEAQAVGTEITARGSQAFEQLQQQIQKALGAGDQGLAYARRFATEAFSPTADQPLFQESSRRLLDTIRPGLAARGLEGGGAGGRAESDATRDLAFQFAQGQRANEQAAIPQLLQAGHANLGPAGLGLGSVSQLAPLLAARYTEPLAGAGSLLQLLSAGQAPNLQLLGTTLPQFTNTSKSSPLGIGIA